MKDSYSIEEKRIAKAYIAGQWAGFTRYAASKGYVIKKSPGEVYFSNMRTGTYIAFGVDVNGNAFKRTYIIDQSDLRSPWMVWRDYNGRYGLKSLWHVTENGKRKIHEK